MKGIDISNWQKGLELTSLRTDFVICKLSEGRSWADPCFDGFYGAAQAIGLPVGAYVFSRAASCDQSKAEAEFAIRLLKGRKLPLGLYMDAEDGAQLALPAAALTDVVRVFCDTVRSAGYLPGVYGSTGTLWRKLRPEALGGALIWAASWGARPRMSCDIWQYSDRERLSGYGGNLDGDEAVSERFIALLNGSEAEAAPAPGPESGHAYAETVYAVKTNLLRIGNYGPQVENMQILLNAHGFDCGAADGIFGGRTQAALRSFQSAAGIAADGIWGGESFRALWNYGGNK